MGGLSVIPVAPIRAKLPATIGHRPQLAARLDKVGQGGSAEKASPNVPADPVRGTQVDLQV
ncbi:MAG: hypothetical protein QNJ94_18480 [Alphaproteobacteria bacterium]|nr:hypothetical protein [Alphaproteobacteria bacterium]